MQIELSESELSLICRGLGALEKQFESLLLSACSDRAIDWITRDLYNIRKLSTEIYSKINSTQE